MNEWKVICTNIPECGSVYQIYRIEHGAIIFHTKNFPSQEGAQTVANKLNNPFVEDIRYLMNHGLSVKDIGYRLGVSHEAVNCWLTGKHPLLRNKMEIQRKMQILVQEVKSYDCPSL